MQSEMSPRQSSQPQPHPPQHIRNHYVTSHRTSGSNSGAARISDSVNQTTPLAPDNINMVSPTASASISDRDYMNLGMRDPEELSTYTELPRQIQTTLHTNCQTLQVNSSLTEANHSHITTDPYSSPDYMHLGVRDPEQPTESSQYTQLQAVVTETLPAGRSQTLPVENHPYENVCFLQK